MISFMIFHVTSFVDGPVENVVYGKIMFPEFNLWHFAKAVENLNCRFTEIWKNFIVLWQMYTICIDENCFY